MALPPTRFDFTAPLPALAELGAVHLIAIGGAGMSAVARLLLARGVAVSGSDAKDSGLLAELRDAGARVFVGHDPAHLAGARTVVVSTAIREDNPELAAARAAGLRVLHRAQALAVVTEGRRRIAVAGANGKTTTSSMLTVALAGAGRDPAFAVGGEIAQLGTNAGWAGGPEAVLEADESDGSFLVYRPEVAVVTNVQPDHLDFYGTFDAVRQAYAAFADSATELLIACADDDGSAALAARSRARGARVLTYGRSEAADLVIASSRAVGLGSVSLLRLHGTEHEMRLGVPGTHNVLDAAAAFLAAVAGTGAAAGPVLDALAGFIGARRRFEILGSAGGVQVVDDYAHNPAKVAAVVSTAAALLAPGARLHVVFQPHLFSRTADFAAEFAAALASASDVVLLPIYAAREDPVDGVTSALIGTPLRAAPGDREVVLEPDFDAALGHLASRVRAGDLVLTVGAGDVTRLGPRILELLRERS